MCLCFSPYPKWEVSPLSTAATPAQDSAPKRSTRFNYNHVSVQNCFRQQQRNSLYACSTFVPLSGFGREIPSSVTTEPLSSAVAYHRSLFDCWIDRDGCAQARGDPNDLTKQAGQDLQDAKPVLDTFADCMRLSAALTTEKRTLMSHRHRLERR